MLTTIPFSGFYNSIHDAAIDSALEEMLSDSSGCHPASDSISERIWLHVDTPTVEYTQAYVESFQAMLNDETGLNIKLTWESVNSPRSYKFTTDRIFATVSLAEVQSMLSKVDRAILDRAAKERFTSYDGFLSSYSPDWASWGDIEDWDHNQIGTLIEALVSQFFEEYWEQNLIEDWNGNGVLDDWIYDELDAEGKRLVKLAGYLREREERKFR